MKKGSCKIESVVPKWYTQISLGVPNLLVLQHCDLTRGWEMPLPLVQAAFTTPAGGTSKGCLEICGAFLKFELDF